MGSLGPYVADLSGIALALLLPAIRFGSRAPSSGEGQVRDFEGQSSSNPIFAFLEDAIRERILERMQLEITVASSRYGWDAIRRAAKRALEEEMTIRPLGRAEYGDARRSIKAFKAHANPLQDSMNRYEALLHLLRWCSFKRLRRGLDTAKGEAQ